MNRAQDTAREFDVQRQSVIVNNDSSGTILDKDDIVICRLVIGLDLLDRWTLCVFGVTTLESLGWCRHWLVAIEVDDSSVLAVGCAGSVGGSYWCSHWLGLRLLLGLEWDLDVLWVENALDWLVT